MDDNWLQINLDQNSEAAIQPIGLASQWSEESRGKLSYFKMEIGQLMTLNGLVIAGDLTQWPMKTFIFFEFVCS